MTLLEGDHVVKIDPQTGKPAENEVYVEFEVLGPPMHHHGRVRPRELRSAAEEGALMTEQPEETPESAEPEIVGSTAPFGTLSGTEEEGTLVGAVSGGWENQEEPEVPAPPSPDNPVPIEVAKEAAPRWEEQLSEEQPSAQEEEAPSGA
jgi:hypothetical protein